MKTTYTPRHEVLRAKLKANASYGIGQLAFDAFLFSITVGIWGCVISMMILKWVMP